MNQINSPTYIWITVYSKSANNTFGKGNYIFIGSRKHKKKRPARIEYKSTVKKELTPEESKELDEKIKQAKIRIKAKYQVK